jgi:hypothetical protein
LFSWSIHTLSNSSKLVLIVPMHYMMVIVLSFGILIAMALTMKAGHGLRNLLIFAFVVLAYGFMTYSCELTLDRANGTATFKEFQYFHWRTHTYPISHIDSARVSTGSTTSRIDLQFTDGSVLPLTFLDQNGGKEEAVYAVNQFLGNVR